jgi:hypothetical protein
MNRLAAFVKAFGWQGGTIPLVARETGCTVADLLYGTSSAFHLGSDHSKGWFAGRTNRIGFNKENVFPNYKGNLDFWLGVADGIIQQEAGR